MNETVTIELSGPPQGKGRARFRVVRTRAGAVFGNAYTPAETRKYETALGRAAQAAMVGRKPFTGPLSVTIEALFPIPQSWSHAKWDRAVKGAILPTTRPDLDNLMKVVDALNGVVWDDDKQIVTAAIKKRYSDKPALVIVVKPEAVHGALFEEEAA